MKMTIKVKITVLFFTIWISSGLGNYSNTAACIKKFRDAHANNNSMDAFFQEELESCLIQERWGLFWTLFGFHQESRKRLQKAEYYLIKHNDAETLAILRKIKEKVMWREDCQWFFIIVGGATLCAAPFALASEVKERPREDIKREARENIKKETCNNDGGDNSDREMSPKSGEQENKKSEDFNLWVLKIVAPGLKYSGQNFKEVLE
jgi:hypothetical protein